MRDTSLPGEWEDLEPLLRQFFHELWSSRGRSTEQLQRLFPIEDPPIDPLFAVGQFVFHRIYGRGQVELRVGCRGYWFYRVEFSDYGECFYSQPHYSGGLNQEFITSLSVRPWSLKDQLMPEESALPPRPDGRHRNPSGCTCEGQGCHSCEH
jgi:hypothetical protein